MTCWFDLLDGEIYHAVLHRPERAGLEIDKMHIALVYDGPNKERLRLQVIGEMRGACIEVDYLDRTMTKDEGDREFRKLTDHAYNGERYLLEFGEDAPRLRLVDDSKDVTSS